jgi:hypothetical protein
MARFALGPTVQAATTLKEYVKKYGDLKLQGLIDALQEQTKGLCQLNHMKVKCYLCLAN